MSNIKINNGDFTFDDKENSVQAQSKAFNVGLNNLKITGSDINLNKLEFLNPRTTCRFPQKTHNLSNFEF